MEGEDGPREIVFFSRCSYFIRLCDRLEISLLFSLALGIFHLSVSLSVFFLPVTLPEQGQKIAYSVIVPETKNEASLILAVGKVGERDGGPSLYGVQNPMEDKKTALVRGAGEPCSLHPGAVQAVKGGTSGLWASEPTRGKGHSAGGPWAPAHLAHPGCEVGKPSSTRKIHMQFLGEGTKHHDSQERVNTRWS